VAQSPLRAGNLNPLGDIAKPSPDLVQVGRGAAPLRQAATQTGTEREQTAGKAEQAFGAGARPRLEYVEAYTGRAEARSYLGNYTGAEEDCTAALNLDSSCAAAHDFLGDAHFKLGRYEIAASKDYTAAINLDGSYAPTFNSRGLALRRQSPPDYPHARDDFQKAIDLAPLPRAAYYENLARTLRDLKQFEDAAGVYKSGWEKQPKGTPAWTGLHLNLARMRLDQQDYDKAEAACKDVIEAVDRAPEAHFLCGLALAGAKKFKEAVAEYKQAQTPGNEYAVSLNLGDAYMGLKQWELAESAYTKAIDTKPTKAAYLSRADARRQLRNREGADADRRKADTLSDGIQ
jgi:tetratricopeptide (TPR) repeat protein